jgi:hypothetical protein
MLGGTRVKEIKSILNFKTMSNNLENNSLKTAFITILTSLGLAFGYHYIGIDSSGKKIDIDNPDKKIIESFKSDELKKKELELKERELKLRMQELLGKFKDVRFEDEINVNLNGNWTGNNGLSYVLTQTNSRVTVTEYNVLFFQQFISFSGTGIIKNNRIEGNGYGIYGQQINLNVEIIDEKTLSLSGIDLSGNPMTITLLKNG